MTSNENGSQTLDLAMQLISRPSVTPDDQGCNQLLMQRLQLLGFKTEVMNFGNVSNFWARLGDRSPVFCFAGHTDVVPSGPIEKWQTPPFEPTVIDGRLFGRGAADMKGSLAAMVVACERYLSKPGIIESLPGSIAFLVTSDEEGIAADGTRKVIEVLEARQEKIDYCLVGEPSSEHSTGDTIKIGRRGSLHGRLRFQGVQGHIAYPHLATNPVHKALAPLQALCLEQWDEGNEAFPPTSFQISNVKAGTGTDNVIPGEFEILFNFRYSTASTEQSLRERTEKILSAHDIPYQLDWHLSGEPFLTLNSRLIDIARASILKVTGVQTSTSTAGGTSDGRFIAPTGTELIELGPCNASIHKVDENVSINALEELTTIYQEILTGLLR
ncbi:MAG: succinyl-diaminopimelate desuccinylase [Pseudomonadales bacterium]|nr:succinyl-diaminopimelate desuccinylase [Pseudomonadales bacterium]